MTRGRHLHRSLVPVTTAAEWRDYHHLRRSVLWEARGRDGYDEAHPDDRRPGHWPFLLTCDGSAIGTIRLDDLGDGTGAVRLVAISPDHRGRGHGRELMTLIEAAARQRGMRRLVVNAVSDAVGFYLMTGWRPGAWTDPSPMLGDIACDQMVKVLAD